MKEKREEDLLTEDYKWDSEGLRRLERQYMPPIIIGGIAFLAVFVLSWFRLIPFGLGFGLLAIVLLLAGGVVLLMFRAQPKGSTGGPLQKFRNSSPNARGLEILYVDSANKTYFKKQFVGDT